MFKEHTVVMLPTKQQDGFAFGKMPGGKLKLCSSMSALGIGTPYDIFILSDEKIKKGDWILNIKTNEIYQVSSFNNGIPLDKKGNGAFLTKKIIATTDKQLTILGPTDRGFNNYSEVVPEIPQSFIEHFVEQYNKGYIITEVMVEYKEVKYNSSGVPVTWSSESNLQTVERLKLNPNNTINIKPIKESWSREEVIILMKTALVMGAGNPLMSHSECDKWIEDNL